MHDLIHISIEAWNLLASLLDKVSEIQTLLPQCHGDGVGYSLPKLGVGWIDGVDVGDEVGVHLLAFKVSHLEVALTFDIVEMKNGCSVLDSRATNVDVLSRQAEWNLAFGITAGLHPVAEEAECLRHSTLQNDALLVLFGLDHFEKRTEGTHHLQRTAWVEYGEWSIGRLSDEERDRRCLGNSVCCQ